MTFPADMIGKTITFDGGGWFVAYDKASAYLYERGFSVGRMQGPDPIGIIFGSYDIQKWRNLRATERLALHGTMTGDKRNGPVTVRIKSALELRLLGLDGLVCVEVAT